jgi:CBS domain containing-hemolysin-like protein
MTDQRSQASSDSRSEKNLVSRIKALFGLSEASVREDLEEVLGDSGADEELSPHERAMLKNVLNLHEVRVRDIMIPRADIIGVSLDADLGEVLAIFRAAEHSRLPVYNETLDDPRGMIHIRDFVDHIAKSARVGEATGEPESPSKKPARPRFGRVDFSASLASAKIVRPVLFVPGSMPAPDLLVKMQSSRTHMALVIDEYGGTDGLVSLEDIVEVVVGDIEDEHDEAEPPPMEASPDGSFIVDARAPLKDVEAALSQSFADLVENDEIETIGGLVATLAGRVPVRGEIVPVGEALESEVLDADPRRLKRLRLRRKPTGPARDATGPQSKTSGSPSSETA